MHKKINSSEKYKAYPEYKDSGVEWLGDVPEHWITTELKRYCSVRGGFAFSSDSFSTTGEPVIRIGDINSDGSISLNNCKFVSEKIAQQSQLYLVHKGELLMAMTGATIGKAGFYEEEVPALVNQRVGLFKVHESSLNYRFLWYTLKTKGYQQYIQLTAFGGAQPNISDTGMVAYKTSFPTCEEQTQIANFLDHETAKIDTLIDKQQQLIKLLKEKRQAVISHAVTRGLNPDAPMKDSGVEWLGEVPEHWVVTRVKNIVTKIVDGPHFSPKYVDEGYMFISARNIKVDRWSLDDAKFVSESDFKEFNRRVRPEKGDVLLTKGGTTGIARAVDLDFPFQVWVHVAVLKTIKKRIDPFFFAYLLNGSSCYEQSQLSTYGATNNDLGLSRIARIVFSLPPLKEQQVIRRELDEKFRKIEELISKANNSILLIQERRTALISAAVTGKIDVRHWNASAVQQIKIEASA